MRVLAGAMMFVVVFPAVAISQEHVRGRVTFIAGSAIYGSLGRKDGLVDSSRGHIVSGNDSVATLRVQALSSRSSSWIVERSHREIALNDTLVVSIVKPETVVTPKDTVHSPFAFLDDSRNTRRQTNNQSLWISVHGRLSLQYYGVSFEEHTQAFHQTGLSFNVNVSLRDAPLRVSLSGVHRRHIRGTLSPFGSPSLPETRLYRVSAEYDDGASVVLVGRIYPMSSLLTTALDGVSVARRFGNFTAGFAGGAEPTLSLKLRQTHLWKGTAFAGYQSTNPLFWGAGAAYTRSYIRSALVRETISLSSSLASPSGVSLNCLADLDLRKPLAESSSPHPMLTSVMIVASARILQTLSVHAGFDGARPLPAVSDYETMPDTLFNRELRSGMTIGTTLWIGRWSWSVSLSPRVGPEQFGKEYSWMTAVGSSNLLTSGVDVQTTAHVNANPFTDYTSYGVQAHRLMWGMDLRARFQYFRTTIRQRGDKRTGTMTGIDLVTVLSESASLMATIDLWRGGATIMNAVFLEASWRF